MRTDMSRCTFCEQPVSAGAVECPGCGAAIVPASARVRRSANRFPADRHDDSTWHAEMSSLVAQGRTIEAVRLYRDRTGGGQAEARGVVEALSRGETMQISPSKVSEGTSAEADLIDLTRQGRKNEAIAAYRDQTGASLREAREAIARLGARHGVDTGGGGCLGMIARTFFAAALVGGLVCALAGG